MPGDKVKVTHVITGLSVGGAEKMLCKLVSAMDRRSFELEVISLMDMGPVGEKIRDLGIPVHALHMARGLPDPRVVWKLARRLRSNPRDVVQTWMYHADLIGGLAAKFAGLPVIWNIRHGRPDPATTKWSTRWTVWSCAKLSRWVPSQIVFCSQASAAAHAEQGYVAEKVHVIPNGFDLMAFKPDDRARSLVRQELGIPEKAPVVGLIARYHPDKDHANFLHAAARVYRSIPDAHFVLCGHQVTPENPELTLLMKRLGIGGRCHLLGPRLDVDRLMAAFDIACSSSSTEGFPNAVAEAMACGVPCVVTDVGDSSYIVGDTGEVVPPRDSEALADAICRLLRLDGTTMAELRVRARQRVDELFNLSVIVRRYETMYKKVCGKVASG